jgi:hypothetical protein
MFNVASLHTELCGVPEPEGLAPRLTPFDGNRPANLVQSERKGMGNRSLGEGIAIPDSPGPIPRQISQCAAPPGVYPEGCLHIFEP